MGEIKSTLDLVMERTGHLSMSAEEKEAKRREDFLKRLQGLLQQYLDEGQTAERLLEHVAALRKEMDLADDHLPALAVLGRIDPDQKNDRWFELLEHLAPGACNALRDLLEQYRQKRSHHLQAARKAARESLAREQGITGSAVAPNPLKNAACLNALAALRDETRTAIETLAGRISQTAPG
mgnify:CR=1 FL=1